MTDTTVTAETAEVDPRIEALRTGTIVSYWAGQSPDLPAIISPSGDRTFAELDAKANQLVRALRRRGLTAGDAVALMCTNRPEFVEVYAACIRAGWRMTPINFHLTGSEAAYIVTDCEAKAFVADVRIGDAAIETAREATAADVKLAIGGAIEGFESYDDALSAEDATAIDDPSMGGTMLYTSGTTGRPKGVHRATAATPRNRDAEQASGYRSGEHLHLCTGPLYHAAPLGISLAAPLAAGVGVVLMEGWDAEEALRLIEAHGVTHTHMVPTMFHRVLALPDDVRRKYDVSSLTRVVHGAAPCPVAVKQALIEWLGPVVWEYYAATEGGGTLVDSKTWLEHPGTVGKPNPPEQVIVGDDDANPLPAGQIGTVYIKAPDRGRFNYFKDEAKTASSYRGSYFTLGDMGYIDEEGYLFLTDRSANLIISGGVNIYPAEVDAVLLEHPAVGDVATIGVPNDEWGEEVKAVVELQAGVLPSPELAAELMAFARERLSHYKCPRSVDFIDTLPRQDNGKIYKRLLRDRYRAGAAG